MTERMRQTAREAERLCRVKAPYERKAEVLRVKMLPKAIFGCESTPINERSKFTNALTYTTTQRSVDLTSAAASKGSDVDPEVEVLTRRVKSLKRAIVRNKKDENKIKKIMELYKEKGAQESSAMQRLWTGRNSQGNQPQEKDPL